MTQLLTQAKENLSFVLMCIVIVTALSLLSKFAEKFFPQKRAVTPARRITIIAVCGAIAAVLHMLDFPLLFLAPEFYKLDFSELPALLASFAYGPMAGATVCLIKNVIHVFIGGTTAGVGELSNFLMGVMYVVPAGLIYQKMKSRKGAIVGMIAGSIVATVVGVLTYRALPFDWWLSLLIADVVATVATFVFSLIFKGCGIFSCNGYHQPQIGIDHLPDGILISCRAAFCQNPLLLRRKQRKLSDMLHAPAGFCVATLCKI